MVSGVYNRYVIGGIFYYINTRVILNGYIDIIDKIKENNYRTD